MPSFIFTASQGFYGSAFFLQNIAQIKFFHVHVVRFAQLQLTVIDQLKMTNMGAAEAHMRHISISRIKIPTP